MPAWAKCAALYSASGHHLKFPDPFAGFRTGTKVTLLLDHPNFRNILQFGCDTFQLDALPASFSQDLLRITRSVDDSNITTITEKGFRRNV
jgi:hypothetical protein